MYIEVRSLDDGRNEVTLYSSAPSADEKAHLVFTTPQQVTLEVGPAARVALAKTRTNGVRTEVDRSGDAWLTGYGNRLPNATMSAGS